MPEIEDDPFGQIDAEEDSPSLKRTRTKDDEKDAKDVEDDPEDYCEACTRAKCKFQCVDDGGLRLCVDCSNMLCKPHLLINIANANIRRIKPERCKEHAMTFDSVCNCSEGTLILLCKRCTTGGAHSTHRHTPLMDVYRKEKGETDKLITKLQNYIMTTNETKIELEKYLMSLSFDASAYKELNGIFESFSEKIVEGRAATSNQVSKIIEDYVKCLQDRQKLIQNVREENNQIKDLLKARKNLSPLQFLRMQQNNTALLDRMENNINAATGKLPSVILVNKKSIKDIMNDILQVMAKNFADQMHCTVEGYGLQYASTYSASSFYFLAKDSFGDVVNGFHEPLDVKVTAGDDIKEGEIQIRTSYAGNGVVDCSYVVPESAKGRKLHVSIKLRNVDVGTSPYEVTCG